MPSIIEGYSYDIFISYRQNDNKYDGWVTEFVDNLNKELEANIKDKISVYFDINPQDGLLETHSVDRSLEEKLRCLIFIPIISRTYCDSKSFAWQHEFCAFNKLAKEDKFGREIRLVSGNVASRILPIKIHDLDPEDKSLLENELGGVLRCIEFIYKAAGVNRPLRANEDHPQDNLNKTYYRDQINKVANAVKEIITGLKNPDHEGKDIVKLVTGNKLPLWKNRRAKIIAGVLIALVWIFALYLIIPNLLKPAEHLEKSIAVLPFENLSGDEEQLWFSDGITDVIISQLSKISDLRVLGRTSTLKYKEEQKSTISEIGAELGVNYLIEGTVQRQGNKMRITVQLVRVVNEGHIWSDIYDREWKDIFEIQSDIAQRIAEGLKTVLTPEEKAQIEKSETRNPEAYNLYLQGRYLWGKRTRESLRKSVEYFEKAIVQDPNYALAYCGLADSYYIQSFHDYISRQEGFLEAKKFAFKAIDLDRSNAEAHATLGELFLWSDWKWEEARKEFLRAIELNPDYANAHFYYSHLLDVLGQNEEARKQINLAMDLDPVSGITRAVSALYYYFEGRFEKSLEESEKSMEIEHDYYGSHFLNFLIYIELDQDLKALEALKETMSLDTLQIKNIKTVSDIFNSSGLNGIINWVIGSQLKPMPNYFYKALLYNKLGQKEEALDCLENGVAERTPDIPRIHDMVEFDYLHSEPRFQALIKKMGLSEYHKSN